MDDSERSYGYSEDIYHGKKGQQNQEGSYEVSEREPGLETEDPDPLEEAMHLVDEDEVAEQLDEEVEAAGEVGGEGEEAEVGQVADGDAQKTVEDVEGKPPKESSALG